MNWKTELAESIINSTQFPPGFSLSPAEKSFFNECHDRDTLPFSVTPYYFSLIDVSEPEDPIRKQCIPTEEEFLMKEYENKDPLFEKDYEPLPFLVHRYKNRVLLRLTNRCAMYCRHCFRRFISGKWLGAEEKDRVEQVIDYLSFHPEIEEVLISGGDPLVLEDDFLLSLLESIRRIKKDLVLRLCTRIPVVLPQRINPLFVDALAALQPLWLVTQFNHPHEITEESREALSCFISKGIPVLNQTVLLKGINDDPVVLNRLFHLLITCRVKPYYLFQGDLACGTSHFRVNLNKGLEIYHHLKKITSGLALPRYSVDLPEGGGKIILTSSAFALREKKWFVLKDYNGNLYKYPAEHE
ncbi:MAG: KamA family radical SAM protein [Spirochaetales bacterium]|nr:KamA family radical SAM protein [Spirochaetales bacterium]